MKTKKTTIYAWTKASSSGAAFHAKLADLGHDLLVQGPALAGVAVLKETPAPLVPSDKGVTHLEKVAVGQKGDLVVYWASCPEAEAHAFAARPRQKGVNEAEDAQAFAREQIGKLQRFVERELAKRQRAADEAQNHKLEVERFLKTGRLPKGYKRVR